MKSSAGGSGVPGFGYVYLYDVPGPGIPALNTIGRMTEESNTVNASVQFSYDPMGRIKQQWNTLPFACCSGTANPVTVTYDLAGDITSITYPDGRVVNQTWDSGGHLIQIADGTGYQYLTTGSYWPNGAPQGIGYGNGVANGYDMNNRQQTNEIGHVRIGASAPGNFASNFNLSIKEYCYGPATTELSPMIPGCPAILSGAVGAGNDGNIWEVMDTLNPANTQGFIYDSLNRLTSFTLNGLLNQTFQIDSFGNMNQTAQSGGLSSGLSFAGASNNQITNLSCTPPSGGAPYDSAGNQLCSGNTSVGVMQYAYDAESKLVSVNSATYTYDANGNRVRKDVSPTNWTEYVNFNGQTLAEMNSEETWSDYIFANGQRIAKAQTADVRVDLSGVNTAPVPADRWIASIIPVPTYTIQPGDVLAFRMYQTNAAGGLSIGFTDGSNTDWYCEGDTNNNCLKQESQSGVWVNRIVPLDASVTNKTISYLFLENSQGAPSGPFDIMIADMSITSTNGTVTPILTRQPIGAIPTGGGDIAGVTDLQCISETVNNPADAPGPQQTTTYYSDDQIGSTSILTTAAGWPISSSSYYPFGAEINPSAGNNHYKFTGKERDAESGLDYFGARYYGSSMGRWMSPDWADKPEAVPYSSLDNPQSLNLYGYVRNNPLSHADADGHCCDDQLQFLGGVIQGAASSVSFGLVGAPRSSDSNASLAGQLLGTSIIGGTGTSIVSGSGPTALGGLALAPETGGASLVVSAGAVGASAIGSEMTAGAAANGVAVAATMARRAGDFSGSTREGAIKDNAAKNGGTNKCEKCGGDVQRVGNQKGQSPPGDQLQVHHDPAIKDGGGKDSTPVVVCRDCHVGIHNPQ